MVSPGVMSCCGLLMLLTDSVLLVCVLLLARLAMQQHAQAQYCQTVAAAAFGNILQPE